MTCYYCDGPLEDGECSCGAHRCAGCGSLLEGELGLCEPCEEDLTR